MRGEFLKAYRVRPPGEELKLKHRPRYEADESHDRRDEVKYVVNAKRRRYETRKTPLFAGLLGARSAGLEPATF